MQYMWYIILMQYQTNIKLKLARVEKDMSQQDLAERAGATRQTIGLIEKGRYNPSLNLCIKIARTLDKTLDQLFWEDHHEETLV